jgi:hypothetical protein
MKKLLISIALLGMLSCAVKITHFPATEVFYGIDFTQYTDKGFLFTPEKYLGEYQSIGMVSIEVYPEYNYNPTRKNEAGQKLGGGVWMENGVKTGVIMDRFYQRITEMGGDALMNFKLESVEKSEGVGSGIIKSFSGTRISGYAIKRL